VTLEQMLVGLLRNNPAAFEGQNMNRLRAGAILRAPAQDTLTAVTPAEASRIFTAQTSDFANYRRSVATRAGEAPLVRAPEASREASGRITAQVQDQTATADASRDRVMLSRATEAPAAAAAGAAGRPGPTAEDAALRDRALQEADTRVALLEKTVADLQKLIELKNQNLQELQRLAESQGKALPPLAALGQTPGASTPGGSGVGGLPQAPASSPRAAVVPAGSTSLVNDLMANPLALGGGVAILLLIAALTAYNLRRKRKFAGFEDSNLTGHSSLHANSVFGVAGGGSVDTRNSGFNSNFVPQGGVASDSNEVDPVAEADVYIAYGRDAQAEEILREALRNQPERIAVRLKLLELFAKREDVAEFEVIATELHTTTGGAGPDWEFAAKLGAKIDPQNVLYRIEGDASGEGAAQSPNGHPAGSSGGMVTTAAVLASGVIGEAAAEAKTSSSPAQGQGFQNTLPMTPAPDGHADTAKVRDEAGADKDEIAAPQDLDFDLTFDAPPTAAEAPTPASSAASSAAEATEAPNFMPALDFDLDLTTPPDVKPATAATAATAATVVAPSDPATPQLEPLAFDPVPAETSGNAAKDAGSETSGAAANESALDFEFDLELPDAPAADVAGSKGGAPASASMDETSSEMGQSSSADKSPLADISFDLDIDTAADMEAPIAASGDSADQSPADAGREMATKLELAAAYRDIGDTDGARELLEEVIKGGDSAQIEQANELLKSLA